MFGSHCSAPSFAYMSWLSGGVAARNFCLYDIVLVLVDGKRAPKARRIFINKSRAKRAKIFRVTKTHGLHLYVLHTYMSWFWVTTLHFHLYVLPVLDI